LGGGQNSKGVAKVEQDAARIARLLSLLYVNQGKLVKAEQMYQRALQGKEKAWSLDYTSTLSTVNNLANLYAD